MQGGYSSHIVVREEFCLRIDREMHEAGTAPLLCAGITTYEPMKVRHNCVVLRFIVTSAGQNCCSQNLWKFRTVVDIFPFPNLPKSIWRWIYFLVEEFFCFFQWRHSTISNRFSHSETISDALQQFCFWRVCYFWCWIEMAVVRSRTIILRCKTI